MGGLGGRGDIPAGNADSRSTRAPFTLKFISVVVKPSEAAASQVLYAHGEPRARHQHLREFRKDTKPVYFVLSFFLGGAPKVRSQMGALKYLYS